MSRRVLKQKTLGVILLLAVGGAVIWLVAAARGQSVGTISSPKPAASSGTTTKTLRTSGKYISFVYPSNFTLKPSKPNGPILENFYLATRSIPFDDLTISVLPLPSGNLEDSSAYSMRLQDPNRYSLEMITASKQTYTIFSDTSGGYAKLAFAVNGNLVTTVSLSSQSGDRGDILDKDLQTVLASLQWNSP